MYINRLFVVYQPFKRYCMFKMLFKGIAIFQRNCYLSKELLPFKGIAIFQWNCYLSKELLNYSIDPSMHMQV